MTLVTHRAWFDGADTQHLTLNNNNNNTAGRFLLDLCQMGLLQKGCNMRRCALMEELHFSIQQNETSFKKGRLEGFEGRLQWTSWLKMCWSLKTNWFCLPTVVSHVNYEVIFFPLVFPTLDYMSNRMCSDWDSNRKCHHGMARIANDFQISILHRWIHQSGVIHQGNPDLWPCRIYPRPPQSPDKCELNSRTFHWRLTECCVPLITVTLWPEM